MKDYTSTDPVFSESIPIVEEEDLVNAENNNAAAKQLLQNILVLAATLAEEGRNAYLPLSGGTMDKDAVIELHQQYFDDSAIIIKSDDGGEVFIKPSFIEIKGWVTQNGERTNGWIKVDEVDTGILYYNGDIIHEHPVHGEFIILDTRNYKQYIKELGAVNFDGRILVGVNQLNSAVIMMDPQKEQTLGSWSMNSDNGIFYLFRIKNGENEIAMVIDENLLIRFYQNVEMMGWSSIQRPGVGSSWFDGRDHALLKQTSLNNYSPILSMKTISGSWEMGPFASDEGLYFNYVSDENHNSQNNSATQFIFTKTGDIGAKLIRTQHVESPNANSDLYLNYLNNDKYVAVGDNGNGHFRVGLHAFMSTTPENGGEISLVPAGGGSAWNMTAKDGNFRLFTYANNGKEGYCIDTNGMMHLPNGLAFEEGISSKHLPFILGIEGFAEGGKVYWEAINDVSVGYAVNADNAYKLGGVIADNFLQKGLSEITFSGNSRIMSLSGNTIEMIILNAIGIGYRLLFTSYNDARYFYPSSDADCNLGNSGNRWKVVYSFTSAIVTSDRNRKCNINELDDRYVEFFKLLIPVSFQLIDGTSGRTHIGFISQDVEEAMDKVGLTSLEFAGFCKDQKTERVVEVQEITNPADEEHEEEWVEKKEVEVEKPVFDDDGKPVYIYSLRYEEFIALNTMMVQKHEKTVNGCEERIKKLEKTVQNQQKEIDALKEENSKLLERLERVEAALGIA